MLLARPGNPETGPKGLPYCFIHSLYLASTHYMLGIVPSSGNKEMAHSHCPPGALSNGETKIKLNN